MKTHCPIFCECDGCGANINYGDTIMEFCMSVLQYKGGSFQLAEEAQQADILLILCDSCWHNVDDLDEIRNHLRSSINLLLYSEKTSKSGLDGTDKLDICDGCGAVFDITDIRHSIDRTIGVIARNSYFKIGGLTVTDSVEFSSYCKVCGSVIDSNHLQSTLLDLINRLLIGRGL